MRYTSDCDEPEIVVTECGIISSIGHKESWILQRHL
jgi:hypothetical protein